MTKGLIGRKLGMSHLYSSNGDVVPVTVLEIGPCFVSQIKTVEKEGYSSVQLSYGETKEHRISKAEKGHLSKNNITPQRHLKEFKFEGDVPALGSVIKASDIFKEADSVKVTGVTKGKGFQGVIKRHGHSGGPMAHGSRFHRHPGSMSANSDPSRVFKGRKLPGRMGGVRKSVKKLKIVKVFPEQNVILVSGSVPGNVKSIITVEKV